MVIIYRLIGMLLIGLLSLWINKLYKVMTKTPHPVDRGHIALGIISEVIILIYILIKILV
jgi:hypothetical protein